MSEDIPRAQLEPPSRSPARNQVTRRRFVQGLLAGSVVAGFDLLHWPAFAAPTIDRPALLSGSNFNLTVDHLPVNYTGRTGLATAVNGSVPGPTLRLREGDDITIAVTNHLPVESSMHWHGLRLPAPMDGVPGLSFPGIAPGQTFVYRFPLRQHGTYWYHSHSRFQEQTGQYGALIIDPQGSDPISYNRDYVVMLSDWTDEDPETVLSNLKQSSDYYNYHQPSAENFLTDVRRHGLAPTVSNRMLWARMNMSPADILDVSGAAYTYLINGHPPAANWTALFRPHERVRLRFINGSSMSIFDVRIPNLPMTVVQADGNDVDPITVDEFRISVAETYDVIVQPHIDSAFTIFAQVEDRTGYARATLAPRPGMSAPVPAMDPRPKLTMVDMGMGAMASMPAGRTSNMNMGELPAVNTSTASHPLSAPPAMKMQGTTTGAMDDMPGMDMSGMPAVAMDAKSQPPLTPSLNNLPPPKVTYSTTPFPQPGPHTPLMPAPAIVKPIQPPPVLVLHEGPQIDNLAIMPVSRLADPGNGLDGNGRRVLTYADLRARYRGADPRPPSRTIELHLTGNMDRFIWGFDGAKFSDAEPIMLKLGERVRFVLINDTMMEHPIHLHGLWSELENGNGDLCPYKHTINVKPGERLSYLVSADTPGRWAYHCHLLYHMESGMFRAVIVS